MKKLLKSFKYAFDGVFYTILHEGHFRFHIVAAVYVIFFGARFFALTKGEWAGLLTLIALVLALECVNTAVERICNRVSTRYDKLIKVSKDVCAGAVLVAAVAAVAIALIVFWDPDVIRGVWFYYISHIGSLAALLISAVISVLFITLTPKLFKVDEENKRTN